MGSPWAQVLRRRTCVMWSSSAPAPPGSMAARQLASRGHDVVVLEEHPAIGVPVHCTGLLGLEAFSELDIPRDTILDTTHAARVRRARRQLRARRRRSRARGDRRSRHVRSVARRREPRRRRRAAQQRARAHDQRSRRSASRCGRRRRQPIVHARACILACGANYRFNRQLGLGVPRAFVQSAQLERAFAGPEQVEVHLGREVAPRGFAWVVPFHARRPAVQARSG